MLQGLKPTELSHTCVHCKSPESEGKKHYHAAGLLSETTSWKLFASISKVNKLFSSIRLICSCLAWLHGHGPNDSEYTMLRKAFRLDQCPATSCQCPPWWHSYFIWYSFVTCLANLAYRTTIDFSCRSCSLCTTKAKGDVLLGRKIAGRLDQAPVFLKASDKSCSVLLLPPFQFIWQVQAQSNWSGTVETHQGHGVCTRRFRPGRIQLHLWSRLAAVGWARPEL